MDLLFGNIKNETILGERLKLINKEFSFQHYAIILVETNSYYLSKLSYEQREFIRKRIVDVSEEYFCHFCNYITTSMPHNHIAIIINFEKKDLIFKNFENLLIELKKTINLDNNIAVSSTTNNPENLYKFYKQTTGFLEYRYFLHYHNVFTSKHIKRIEKDSLTFNYTILEQYEILLKSKQYDKLKNSLTDLFTLIKQSKYSISIVRNILIQIISMFSRVSREQGLENKALTKSSLLSTFTKQPFLSFYTTWLFNLIDVYSENVEYRNKNIDNEYFDTITSYIHSHIENNISLQTVSDNFSLSQSHFSRLFKDGSGVNFSDYVFTLKFERATELLLEIPKLTITEIARRLGYYDLAYFSKLYKEKYGMTPSHYRKKFGDRS